jgi:hypothetical protein
VWATNAAVGSEVARMSRKFFFSGALLAFCVISAYAYAGFPYDNLCLNPESPSSGAARTYYNVLDLDNKPHDPISVSRDDVFVYCRQNWRHFNGFIFPPTSKIQGRERQWMTPSQERLTNLYGWSSVVAVVIYFFLFLFRGTSSFILSWFRGTYSPKGQEQHIDFSSDNGKFCYGRILVYTKPSTGSRSHFNFSVFLQTFWDMCHKLKRSDFFFLFLPAM